MVLIFERNINYTQVNRVWVWYTVRIDYLHQKFLVKTNSSSMWNYLLKSSLPIFCLSTASLFFIGATSRSLITIFFVHHPPYTPTDHLSPMPSPHKVQKLSLNERCAQRKCPQTKYTRHKKTQDEKKRQDSTNRGTTESVKMGKIKIKITSLCVGWLSEAREKKLRIDRDWRKTFGPKTAITDLIWRLSIKRWHNLCLRLINKVSYFPLRHLYASISPKHLRY